MSLTSHVYSSGFKLQYIVEGNGTLDKLQAPVFLALDRYDYLQPPPYLWEGVRDKLSNLTIRIFEKSSHTPQFEEPELFDQELLEWLFQKQDSIEGSTGVLDSFLESFNS